MAKEEVEEGTRHLAEARALVSGGCSCSASGLTLSPGG